MPKLYVDRVSIYGSRQCLHCVWGRVVAVNEPGFEPEAVVLCSRWPCSQMRVSDTNNNVT
jgi:hypothetical protein